MRFLYILFLLYIYLDIQSSNKYKLYIIWTKIRFSFFSLLPSPPPPPFLRLLLPQHALLSHPREQGAHFFFSTGDRTRSVAFISRLVPSAEVLCSCSSRCCGPRRGALQAPVVSCRSRCCSWRTGTVASVCVSSVLFPSAVIWFF
jgi:hypothetical protein